MKRSTMLCAAASGLLLSGALLAGAPAGVLAAAPAAASAAAEIELRKSFTKVRGPGRQPSRQEPSAAKGAVALEAPEPGRSIPRSADTVADALGEPVASSGSLHLPLPDGRQVVLSGARTPVLEAASGRRLIIDAGREIDAATAARIAASWPGYAVVQPPVGTGLRGLLDGILSAAGYESVGRGAPLVFGRGLTVRLTPDFLVQRDARDLLQGELRAISVVDPAEAFPPELRELAAGHRVRVIEIAADGSPAGEERAAWRDPIGRVTTMETASPARLLAEVAAALGLPAERAAADPALGGGPGSGGAAGPALAAVGELLRRGGVRAIGPTVELYRPAADGARGRFVISVPGWFAEHEGRRLLITGASPPLPVRLYLTREGIDLFEYRLR